MTASIKELSEHCALFAKRIKLEAVWVDGKRRVLITGILGR